MDAFGEFELMEWLIVTAFTLSTISLLSISTDTLKLKRHVFLRFSLVLLAIGIVTLAVVTYANLFIFPRTTFHSFVLWIGGLFAMVLITRAIEWCKATGTKH